MIRTLLTVLVLSLLSTPVFADWTKVGKSVNGDTFYVDFERIRNHGGYVYYWTLGDFLKPERGVMSRKTYTKVDCNMFRFKDINRIFYGESMGEGNQLFFENSNVPDKNWNYPNPESVSEGKLKSVCKYAK